MTLLCYRMTINTSKASTTLKIFSRLLSVISRWSHSFSSIQSAVHRIQNTFKRNKRTPRKGLWSKYKYRVFRSNYIPIHFCSHLRFTSGVFVLLQYFIVDNYCSIYFVFFFCNCRAYYISENTMFSMGFDHGTSRNVRQRSTKWATGDLH